MSDKEQLLALSQRRRHHGFDRSEAFTTDPHEPALYSIATQVHMARTMEQQRIIIGELRDALHEIAGSPCRCASDVRTCPRCIAEQVLGKERPS